MAGEEASRLRAEAMQQIEKHEEAADILMSFDASEDAMRSFWLAGRWDAMPDALETAGEDSSAAYRRVADLAGSLTNSDGSSDTKPPLAQARDMIEKSEMSRQGIEDLLNTLAVSPSVE